VWIYNGSKLAKFHGNVFSLIENIVKSFRGGATFLTHTVLHALMLENGLNNMCVSTVLSCIGHHQKVNTCADALKSLFTAAELAVVQLNFMKAFATAG